MKSKPRSKIAVLLLSGGLDSAVALFWARKSGYHCECLAFDYGQRHRKELSAAKKVAQSAGCGLKVIKISLPWKGSSLLDAHLKIPVSLSENIPSTYVPARNIIFLSFALSFAEARGAEAIVIGAHTQDYSGYPDCRKSFFRAFERVIATGTKCGVTGKKIKIIAPLIDKKKSEIIHLGARLNVPFRLTWSCYKGGKRPCGECDSCRYRQRGFLEAGIKE